MASSNQEFTAFVLELAEKLQERHVWNEAMREPEGEED